MVLKKDKASKTQGAFKHILKQAQKYGNWLTLACAVQYWGTLTLCGNQHQPKKLRL